LNQFGWDLLTHSPYYVDSAPLGYHLFIKLKETLEEIIEAVNNWSKDMAGSYNKERILKLVVSRYSKYIKIADNYIEK